MDAIAALKTYELSTGVGGKAFKSTPLYNYDPSQTITADNLVVATRVAELPLLAPAGGAGGALKVTVTGNTEASVATTQISGGALIVKPVAGQTGTTVITLQAKDQTKTKVTISFNVTVL